MIIQKFPNRCVFAEHFDLAFIGRLHTAVTLANS